MIKAQVGETVVVDYYDNNQYELARVTRITNTQVHTTHGKFNRETGRGIGTDQWHFTYILDVTEELLHKVEESKAKRKRRNRIATLENVPWNILTDTELKQIIELVAKTLDYTRKDGWYRKEQDNDQAIP